MCRSMVKNFHFQPFIWNKKVWLMSRKYNGVSFIVYRSTYNLFITGASISRLTLSLFRWSRFICYLLLAMTLCSFHYCLSFDWTLSNCYLDWFVNSVKRSCHWQIFTWLRSKGSCLGHHWSVHCLSDDRKLGRV